MRTVDGLQSSPSRPAIAFEETGRPTRGRRRRRPSGCPAGARRASAEILGQRKLRGTLSAWSIRWCCRRACLNPSTTVRQPTWRAWRCRRSLSPPPSAQPWTSRRSPEGLSSTHIPGPGEPGEPLLVEDWDSIPGARGCTPETCGFRDHHGELVDAGAAVYGLSTQDTAHQRELAERLGPAVRRSSRTRDWS